MGLKAAAKCCVQVLSHKLSQMAASAASTLGDSYSSIAKDLEHHVQQALQRQSTSDNGQGDGKDSASRFGCFVWGPGWVSTGQDGLCFKPMA